MINLSNLYSDNYAVMFTFNYFLLKKSVFFFLFILFVSKECYSCLALSRSLITSKRVNGICCLPINKGFSIHDTFFILIFFLLNTMLLRIVGGLFISVIGICEWYLANGIGHCFQTSAPQILWNSNAQFCFVFESPVFLCSFVLLFPAIFSFKICIRLSNGFKRLGISFTNTFVVLLGVCDINKNLDIFWTFIDNNI